MSIFVSNAIKDIVDLESITEIQNKLDNKTCYIEATEGRENIKLSFKQIENISDSLFCLKLTVNLNIFEKLFFKKVKLQKIFIGNTCCVIKESRFKRSLENGNMYDVLINLKIKEEFNV